MQDYITHRGQCREPPSGAGPFTLACFRPLSNIYGPPFFSHRKGKVIINPSLMLLHFPNVRQGFKLNPFSLFPRTQSVCPHLLSQNLLCFKSQQMKERVGLQVLAQFFFPQGRGALWPLILTIGGFSRFPKPHKTPLCPPVFSSEEKVHLLRPRQSHPSVRSFPPVGGGCMKRTFKMD